MFLNNDNKTKKKIKLNILDPHERRDDEPMKKETTNTKIKNH